MMCNPGPKAYKVTDQAGFLFHSYQLIMEQNYVIMSCKQYVTLIKQYFSLNVNFMGCVGSCGFVIDMPA